MKLLRACYGRQNICPYSLRVVEPHHEGCPHWHLLLFLPKRQVKLLVEILTHYALEVDGNERGAKERRITVKERDPAKGLATGYLVKNIDGAHVGVDLFGFNAIDSATRTLVWAATWNIRQFQQIGGPSVTVWRECRRLVATGKPLASSQVAHGVPVKINFQGSSNYNHPTNHPVTLNPDCRWRTRVIIFRWP